MQTRDQRYATTAYEHVSTIKEKEKKKYKLYGSLAHKLPILIHSAGLAQALAFVNTRVEEKISEQFLNDLAQTIDRENGETLLKNVREANLSEYMLLTQQVLAALLWYKRFTQSILNVEASDASQEGLHE
jgi:CRISPR-associated protein Cmr5